MSFSKNLSIREFRSPLDRIALVIGTFFGSGLLPKMPGTWGTLAAIPVTYCLHFYYPNPFHPMHWGFWLILLILGTWACKRVCALTNKPDNQALVIDEVVGFGICAAMAGTSWYLLFVCFILFRFFDIAKIPPVAQLDRLSKRSDSRWVQGFGVMADDVLAGIQGLILFYFIAPRLMDYLANSGAGR